MEIVIQFYNETVEIMVDGEVEITIIADENEKQRVLELFSKQKDFHMPQEG